MRKQMTMVGTLKIFSVTAINLQQGARPTDAPTGVTGVTGTPESRTRALSVSVVWSKPGGRYSMPKLYIVVRNTAVIRSHA